VQKIPLLTGLKVLNATNPKLKEGKVREIYLELRADFLTFCGFGKVFAETRTFLTFWGGSYQQISFMNLLKG
jgi:hypothetical protein